MAQTTFSQTIVRPQPFMDSAFFDGGFNSAFPSTLSIQLREQLCEMAKARYQVRQLLWKLVFATFLLMAIGSATRVMNAGLACPDWPLCYGTLIPVQQMNLQVFLEWIHRLDASLIGLMTIGLVGLSIWQRMYLPRWLPWTAMLAFVLVCVQGGLGALTVTALLRFDVVTAHLGTALCFFALLLGMSIALVPSTSGSGLKPLPPKMTFSNESSGTTSLSTVPQVFVWLSLGTTTMIYVQSLTGGLVGSKWALHQCLAIVQQCAVMNSHLLGVIPSTVGVLVLLLWSWKHRAFLDLLIQQLMHIAGLLLLIQLCLGMATFHLHLEVEPLTIAHQATGAALFGVLLCVTVRSCLLWFSSSDVLAQSLGIEQ